METVGMEEEVMVIIIKINKEQVKQDQVIGNVKTVTTAISQIVQIVFDVKCPKKAQEPQQIAEV
jgi:hypothetical protein